MGYPKTTVELFSGDEFIAEINIIGTEPVDWIKICDILVEHYANVTHVRVWNARNELIHEVHLS